MKIGEWAKVGTPGRGVRSVQRANPASVDLTALPLQVDAGEMKERLSKIGFTIMTKEYVGGIIAGFGVGIIVSFVIFWPEHRVSSPFALLLGTCCTTVGSMLARAAQRKKLSKVDE